MAGPFISPGLPWHSQSWHGDQDGWRWIRRSSPPYRRCDRAKNRPEPTTRTEGGRKIGARQALISEGMPDRLGFRLTRRWINPAGPHFFGRPSHDVWKIPPSLV